MDFNFFSLNYSNYVIRNHKNVNLQMLQRTALKSTYTDIKTDQAEPKIGNILAKIQVDFNRSKLFKENFIFNLSNLFRMNRQFDKTSWVRFF